MYRVAHFNPQSKYHSTRAEYNGRIYHSKFEAHYAQELDLRKKAHDIQDWIPQVRIRLDVNGYHICNYIVDFEVIHNDGSHELIEIKGFETEVWRLKANLLEATYLVEHPDTTYTVVRS